MHQRIYDELKRLAASRGMTTYGEIAPLAGLDMSLQRDRTEIGRILGEISRREHEQGRPLLSAIVIWKDGDSRGKGFFTLARELGLLKPAQGRAGVLDSRGRQGLPGRGQIIRISLGGRR